MNFGCIISLLKTNHPNVRTSRFKRYLLLLPALVLAGESLAFGGGLVRAGDLRHTAREARQRHLPILLMVSRSHCGFCERMKDEVLKPMLLSGDHDSRVLIRELRIDPEEWVTDFQGRRLPASEFSARYQTEVTPTLLFLDPDGNEAAPRIIGINTVDLLPFYIENALAQAIKRTTER